MCNGLISRYRQMYLEWGGAHNRLEHLGNLYGNCESVQKSTGRKETTKQQIMSRLHLKRDGTCAETRFCLLLKQTSPFKSAGASVQSTTGSRGVRISSSNAGYTTFQGSVNSTGYSLHSPVSPSLPLPCVTVCHQVSNTLY